MLTDGIITDMQSTIEALIDASHEPLSIISGFNYHLHFLISIILK